MANTSTPDEKPAIRKLYEIFLAGEYAAVRRLIDESAMAPSTRDRIALMSLMGAQIEHFQMLSERVVADGGDVEVAVDRHIGVFDRYHQVTEPSNWLEVLVKQYIGDGMVADFFAEMADMIDALPDDAKEVLHTVSAPKASSEWAVAQVRAGVAADPAIAAPLTLWGRRLLGEAITHMQWVLAEDDDVMDLLFTKAGSLAGVTVFFDNMAERHAQRMADVSLG